MIIRLIITVKFERYYPKRASQSEPMIFLIAAIAKANQLTLVTHNTREFIRIPDLLLEYWL